MERRRGKGSTGAHGVDFQEALRRFLASRQDGANFHLVSLWRAWPRILGEELAALALPLGAQERVLLVGAEDNPSLSELSFQVPFILKQTNAFLRQDYFTGVKLELLQGRRPLGRP
ncbi:MAG: DUF721 domain-containing protein [Desulfovibrionaceae bacterium]|nr:DUF721 domain-containing protein [Desulfovibrionaceae bacterium]